MLMALDSVAFVSFVRGGLKRAGSKSANKLALDERNDEEELDR